MSKLEALKRDLEKELALAKERQVQALRLEQIARFERAHDLWRAQVGLPPIIRSLAQPLSREDFVRALHTTSGL